MLSDPEVHVLDDLTSDDPKTRVLTVEQVKHTDLGDPAVLDAMLKLCRDATPLPDDMQPPVPDDPFADFFGQSKAAPKKATIADKACERLVFTGVIGDAAAIEALAGALSAEDCGEPLVKAAAKVLGQTQWEDRLAAAHALVPPLHRHQAALYEVVVRFGADEHAVMIASALNPYNSRAVNELLNHQASKPAMEEALRDAVVAGGIREERDAADALTLLVAWDSEHLAEVAAALESSFPWALLVLGLDDTAAAERLQAWLEEGHPAPVGLVRKLQEGLKTRDDLPHYPLAAWLRYAGTGVDVVRQWGAAARCREVLESFVAAHEEAPERAWDAVVALIEASEHDGVNEAILAGLERDNPDEWSRGLFEALARARPPVPGLLGAFRALLERHPLQTRAVVPALLQGFPPEELRGLAETYIGWCEDKPVIQKPSRPGLIHEEREGVDPVPLQALVNFLGDDALTARLQEVLPYVRAEG